MHQNILIIEDEPSIADALIHALETESFIPRWEKLGQDGINYLRENPVDLIVLDIGLPDTNGFDVCREIKKITDIPIIFLTARKEEVDKLIGLEIGGDDYVTKPFSLRELVSRIKVVLRRYEKTDSIQKEEKKITKYCVVNDDEKNISFFNEKLSLTRYEYRMLKTLVENPDRVFSREVLMDLVWEEPEKSFERSVDTHIKTLRQKMRLIQPDMKPIKTHHGLGYSYSEK